MLLGALIVADVLLRSRNFHFFYIEGGVVPQELAERYTVETAFSVYYYTTDPVIIAGLFALTALVGIQLFVGYKTRIAVVLSFLLVVSLDHHNPLVLSFADTLFRLLLFWAIFLPLGERWSIDAIHRDREPRTAIASVATALILIQVVFVYVSNAVAKAFSDLWRTGEAAPLVLGLDNITFFFGDLTRSVPELLQLGGFVWFLMLSLSWLLFVFRGRLRTAFALLFVGVHASFALTVRIGAFPYVSIAGVLLFLPTQFWRDGSRLVRRVGLDPARFVPSKSAQNRLGEAVPRLDLDYPGVLWIRRTVYTVVLWVVVISILLVVAVLLANLGTITADPETMDDRAEETLRETPVVSQVERVAVSLSIDQPGWSIFAPQPRTTDRYYVFPATTASDDRLDVYNDRELRFERPQDELQRQFGTYRERFYMNSVRRAGSVGHAPVHLAAYYCTEYEKASDSELVRLNMYQVTETVTMETIDSHESRQRESSLLSRHACGKHEPGPIVEPPF